MAPPHFTVAIKRWGVFVRPAGSSMANSMPAVAIELPQLHAHILIEGARKCAGAIDHSLTSYVTFFLLDAGMRAWIQRRRTGDTGIRVPSTPQQWWARGTLALGILVPGIAAPIAELLRLPALPLLDQPVTPIAGIALTAIGVAASFGAQLAMGASWRTTVDPQRTAPTGGRRRVSHRAQPGLHGTGNHGARADPAGAQWNRAGRPSHGHHRSPTESPPHRGALPTQGPRQPIRRLHLQGWPLPTRPRPATAPLASYA